jgi:hypothetical protein
MMDEPGGSRICPYCASEVNAGALICKWCDRPLQHEKLCPFCKEPIAGQAIRCRFCGAWLTEKEMKRLQPPVPRPDRQIDRTIVASPIGAFLVTLSLTAVICPPELHVTNNHIRLRRWTLFGLRVFDQKVSTLKVASVRFHKGIIWATITLETHGGAMADLSIPAVDTDEGQQMVAVIEEVIGEPKSESDYED